MKKIVISVMAILSLSSLVVAQTSTTNSNDWDQNTAFKGEKMTNGGYGALSFKYGQLDSKSAALIGVKGAWVVSHSLGIGVAGYGIASRSQQVSNSSLYVGYTGGYGGFLIEPTFFSKNTIHFNVPILLGGGFIGQYSQYNYQFAYKEQYVAFGLIEPGLEIEINMLKWFRISAGAYYMFKTEIESTAKLDESILNSLTLGINLKFGAF